MGLLWRWIDLYGIPQSLYTDKKNVYVVDEKTREKAADSGQEVFTQFGRACQQLEIKIITAHSPQAKGRVERNHGTYQDRLVKELRLAEISTIAAGNELLHTGYCAQLNEKFAVAARAEVDFHRSAKGYELASIFCIEEERSVSVDWIVRFENQFYQLQPIGKAAVAKGKVRVRRYLNGELHFAYGGRDLTYTVLPERPKAKTAVKVKSKNPRAQRRTTGSSVPAANHGWRSFQFGKGPPWAR